MEINQKEFDKKVLHPVQSFAWGEFRKKNGYEVERFVVSGKSYTVMFKKLPKINKTIGIMTQSHTINKTVLGKLAILGNKHNAVFVKVEPYIYEDAHGKNPNKNFRKNLKSYGLKRGKDLYPLHSNIIDLTKSESELLREMKSKTRYNIGLSERKGVEVVIDREDESFDEYLKLLKETTSRQGFMAHTAEYQKNMWQEMKRAGVAYIGRAMHEGETLSAWMLFVFGDRIYYPYGASTRSKRNLMAPTLLAWEAMRFGKKKKCREFEMWGCLGPNPSKKHSWYGITRFKTGFGGQLVEYVGAHDMVLEPFWYRLYLVMEKARGVWMSFKKGR